MTMRKTRENPKCDVKQTFCFQKFVDNAKQWFVFTPQANFPAHNLNFHWRSPFKIFSSLLTFGYILHSSDNEEIQWKPLIMFVNRDFTSALFFLLKQNSILNFFSDPSRSGQLQYLWPIGSRWRKFEHKLFRPKLTWFLKLTLGHSSYVMRKTKENPIKVS